MAKRIPDIEILGPEDAEKERRVRDRFWPMATGPNPALHVQGYVNSICTSFMMMLAVVILVSAARRWLLVLNGKVAQRELAAEA